jgi:hypothetical protein
MTIHPCVIDDALVATTDTIDVVDPATGRDFWNISQGRNPRGKS